MCVSRGEDVAACSHPCLCGPQQTLGFSSGEDGAGGRAAHWTSLAWPPTRKNPVPTQKLIFHATHIPCQLPLMVLIAQGSVIPVPCLLWSRREQTRDQTVPVWSREENGAASKKKNFLESKVPLNRTSSGSNGKSNVVYHCHSKRKMSSENDSLLQALTHPK